MDRKAKVWLVTVAAVLLTVAAAYAEVYSMTVTRKDTDLYRIDGTRLYVETRWCYEFAIGEEAILRYDPNEGPYGSNKLVFVSSDTVCDVVRVIG